MKALVIIAHGSKKDSSNNEFLSMVNRIKQKDENSYDFIEAAFLELASPSIKITIKYLLKKAIKEIYLYPYFLNSGKHVLIDIPQIVDNLRKENEDIKFELFPYFGSSLYIDTIILNDIKKNYKGKLC